MTAEARYAIYFTPPAESALCRFGDAWFSNKKSPDIPGFDQQTLRRLTASARHYGFHATLKPPFALAAGATAEALARSVARFAADQAPLEAPPLHAVALTSFVALMPVEPCAALNRLADACVKTFDSYRAAPSEAELERRRTTGLSARQEELLQIWGYPYVFDEFRFHMTLAGPSDRDRIASLLTGLDELTRPFRAEPLVVDAISLVAQSRQDQPFRLLRRFPLTGSGQIRPPVHQAVTTL